MAKCFLHCMNASYCWLGVRIGNFSRNNRKCYCNLCCTFLLCLWWWRCQFFKENIFMNSHTPCQWIPEKKIVCCCWRLVGLIVTWIIWICFELGSGGCFGGKERTYRVKCKSACELSCDNTISNRKNSGKCIRMAGKFGRNFLQPYSRIQ